jgi:hypothetical protein
MAGNGEQRGGGERRARRENGEEVKWSGGSTPTPKPPRDKAASHVGRQRPPA